MDGLQVDTFGLRVNKDIAFTTHRNKFHKGTMNQQLKILRSVEPILTTLLKPDEEILLAAKACSPMSWFEQIAVGWIIVYLKRCILVFTNKRILHFPAKANFTPKRSIAQILYGDIAEMKFRGFLGRVLALKYKSGKKESFHHIPAAQFNKLKTILPSLPKGTQPSEVSERHHLCPKCKTRLLSGKFSCPNCHLTFKNAERAVKLSLLYPGGGYFYTKHPFLGIGDALVEGFLLILIIVSLVDLWMGEAGPESWVSLAIISTVLIIEKLETIYHTKHYVNEYIPTGN